MTPQRAMMATGIAGLFIGAWGYANGGIGRVLGSAIGVVVVQELGTWLERKRRAS